MHEKYKRLKVIGRGAFGKAYLVQDTEADMLVVVKQVDTGGMDEKERNEAVKEAQVLKKMVHPNVIAFQEVFMTRKGRLCIVMEYADGGDLHSTLKARKGELMPEAQILEWFSQECFALKHVHDRKVLHRDLKSQNVFLMKSGQIKLGDFGISRVLDFTKEYAKSMVGSPYYLSPEVIQQRPYSFKSDVWSCGIVLFEMATLQHPFDADCLVALASKILNDDIPPIASSYSTALAELTKGMLRKDQRVRSGLEDVLASPLLHEGGRVANGKFDLGIDLAALLPKSGARLVEEAAVDLAEATGGTDAGAADTSGNQSGSGGAAAPFEDYSGDEGGGEASPQPLLALTKSVDQLKLGTTASTVATLSQSLPSTTRSFASAASSSGPKGKAGALRSFMLDQVSTAEFDKVMSVVRCSAPGAVQRSVAEVLGADRSAALLSMFQLLCLLEEVAAGGLEGGDAESESPLRRCTDTHLAIRGKIVGVFTKWDVNEDGVISRKEFHLVLRRIGLSDAEIEYLFSVADTNKDGNIDYKEFTTWLYSGADAG